MLLVILLSGCGFLGVELAPYGLGSEGDGGFVGADGGGGPDGAIDMDAAWTPVPDASAGTPGNPEEVEICVEGVCSKDVDRCPDDDAKLWPGICGCGISDTADQDEDGNPDCIDLCPRDDVLSAGGCGCSAAWADSDGDGTANCVDYCPNDPDKTGPATCGCDLPDADSDGDGMPDCADACPSDSAKLAPGLCGCGVPDDESDTDGDGIFDCVDTCGGLDDSRYEPDASCGVGYCRTTNTPSSCVDGVETACAPGAPLSGADTTCDGVDDDCNGEADEDYVPTPTANTCGTGACMVSARLQCEAGELVERCQAGNNAPNDVTCDGVDDNCDGTDDEDYQSSGTSCGTGVCASTGMLSCSSGREVDSCTPGSPAANDASCNGLDDDCNGAADEDYLAPATNCGVGACRRTGSLMCSAGRLSDTCVAGTPAGNDATCNGVDEDCSGAADEDYAASATSCGVGACRRSGTRTCSNGQQVDSCAPGTPAANDASCNGVDEDCSGAADEDYAPNTTCGVGYCRTSNTPSSCAGGVESACVPGTPRASDDITPDGVDDDCDGQVDEDACDETTVTYSNTGLQTITVPAGCTNATVRLWGGGGAAGETGGWWAGSIARGGPGGYTQQTLAVTPGSTITLRVAQGGQGCGGAGSNGDAAYNGGTGSTARGGDGGDASGSTTGGTGAATSVGDGGDGRFGGGGGGAGSNGAAVWNPWGRGGGGGSASVVIAGAVQVVAGGGGGGGGASSSGISSGQAGGVGGSGCGANGAAGGGGGGGGGGGACTGTVNQQGSNANPHVPSGVTLPSGRAVGGSASDCSPGGNGYAIIEWSGP